MRMLFCLLIILLTLSVFGQSVIQGKVVRILDGDTFEILLKDNATYKVRMADIDAPEKRQAFGQVSRQKLSTYIFGKEVKVIYEKLDRNQRIIGEVYVGQLLVNLAMIEAGMAWHYKKFSKNQQMAKAEAIARHNRRGLWAAPDALAPWEFRKIKRKKADIPFP